MKTLYIIRHAKSAWNDPSLSDFQRPLNRRGEKNAPFMGKILARHHVSPDLILSSPAVRAKMTTETIAEKVGYKKNKIVYEEELYLAQTDTLLEILRKIPNSENTVFIVGHNPGLTLFAEYISGYAVENIPTCGVFCVRLKEDDWQSLGQKSAEFVSFDYPKKHQNG